MENQKSMKKTTLLQLTVKLMDIGDPQHRAIKCYRTKVFRKA